MTSFVRFSLDVVVNIDQVCSVKHTPAHTNSLDHTTHRAKTEISTTDGKIVTVYETDAILAADYFDAIALLTFAPEGITP